MALFRRNPLKAETAVNYLEAKAVIDELAEQVLDRHNGIIGIAVGRKDRGPVAGAHDFSVTAFVEEKLSQEQLQTRDIEGFDRVAMHAVARQTGRPLTRGDIDVVETAGPMRPIAGLSVPAAQRGTHQGNPPALNAQKWFHSLRIGVGITNPQGEYPHSHSVGSIGFFLRDIDGNTYLVSNNHVIGRLGLAKSPEPIVHPGTIDLSGSDLLNCPDLPTLFARFQVAEFTACVPIHFKSATNIPVNWVDAGMAKLTELGDGGVSFQPWRTAETCLIRAARLYPTIRGRSQVASEFTRWDVRLDTRKELSPPLLAPSRSGTAPNKKRIFETRSWWRQPPPTTSDRSVRPGIVAADF